MPISNAIGPHPIPEYGSQWILKHQRPLFCCVYHCRAFAKAIDLSGGEVPPVAKAAEILKYHVVAGYNTLAHGLATSFKNGAPDQTLLTGQALTVDYQRWAVVLASQIAQFSTSCWLWSCSLKLPAHCVTIGPLRMRHEYAKLVSYAAQGLSANTQWPLGEDCMEGPPVNTVYSPVSKGSASIR